VARFACAQWRPISANTGGKLGPNLGLVLHHAVATGSLYAFFNSPSAEVSAHFWVARDGRIEQYVDTDVVAWHGRDLNGRYVGVETEGCNVAPYAEPMPEAMVAAMGRLYAEGRAVHGWPDADANANGEPGLGFHRMAVNTACPCDERLNMRGEIRRRASGGAPSVPEPSEVGAMEQMQTVSGRGYYIVGADGGVFCYGDAQFFGSVPGLRPPVTLAAPIVGGALSHGGDGYYLVASDGGIFCFGDAAFHGSMGGKPMNAPIRGIEVADDGGYWLLGADGGVFAFGGAPFYGSASGAVAWP
jgi:hypothetical protein